MSRTPPISEVKARLPDLVTGVPEREEEIVATRKGNPAAALVSYGEHERSRATLEVLSDADLQKQIRRSRRFCAPGGTGVSRGEFFGETSGRPKGCARQCPPVASRFPRMWGRFFGTFLPT